MARRTVERVSCDFCGWGGDLARTGDFWHYGIEGVDLCKWCASSSRTASWTECAGHRVTFADDGDDWSCTCGATLRSEFDGMLTPWRVAKFSMMSLPARLGQLHTEGVRWHADGFLQWAGGVS